MIVSAKSGYEMRLPEISTLKPLNIHHNQRKPCQRVPPVKPMRIGAHSELYGFSTKETLHELSSMQEEVESFENSDIEQNELRYVSRGIIRPIEDLAKQREEQKQGYEHMRKVKTMPWNHVTQPSECSNYRFENNVNLMLNCNKLSFKVNDILEKYGDDE